MRQLNRVGRRAVVWFCLNLAMAAWPGFGMPVGAQRGTNFSRTLWRSSEGLPEDIVQALAQDRDGYLWVGTTGGLTRFDGSRFFPISSEIEHRLSVHSIFCLLVARDGTLWAGTEGGGLLHLTREGEVTTYSAPEGLSDSFVRSVFEDAAGRLWVGTDSGLFLKEGERLIRSDQSQEHGKLAVHAIAEDGEHHLWVGGSSLMSLGGGEEQEVPLPGAYSQNRVKSLLVSKDGTLWVGTVSGLFERVKGRFVRIPEIAATVRTLRQTRDGTVWIGTIGRGLWTYRDGALRHVGGKNLLPSDTVLSLFEDDGSRMWVGTQNGLVRLEKTPVEVIQLPGGGDADFGTISGAPDGTVWMVAQKVFRVSDGVPRQVVPRGLEDASIRNLFRARDGSMWVGTDGSGAYHLAGGLGASGPEGAARQIAHLSAPTELTNNFVRAFLESSRGEVWIATDEGLTCVSAGGIKRFGMADGLAHFSTRSLLEDRDHDIWIGTEQGLSRWHAGAFVSDEATTRMQGEKVWSILQDRRGTMWFGTRDHGLFRFQDHRMTQYTTAEGLISNSIFQLLEDRTGRIWISGPDTISSVPEPEMDDDFSRRGRPLSVTLYRMPFEADGAQMYGGRQPAGYLAADDTVWFPTSRGAAHVLPVAESAHGMPMARIESVSQDGQEIPLRDGLHLSARGVRLAFSFAPLLLGPQRGVRFLYKLDGVDPGWISSGASHSAVYTNLAAGHYRFHVLCFDVSRPELTSEAMLDVVKEPYFYQTWWFRLLCAVLAVGCGLLAYRARLKKIRDRFAAVLEERSRLAREMHDTVIQGCTSVSALLEGIAIQRGAAAESDLLDHARQQIRTTIDDARHTVWNLRHEDGEDLDLSACLVALAQQAGRALGIPVVCDEVSPTGPMPGSAGHELLMITREAIANAGSHANASLIRICATFQGEELTLKVVDDGAGFVQKASREVDEGHYGLLGMRERMHRIGGTLAVNSTVGVGTEVVMVLRHATAQPRSANNLQTWRRR